MGVKRIIFLVIVGIVSMFAIVFGVGIPKYMDSKVPDMEKCLLDSGYRNLEIVDRRSINRTITFKTDKGVVSVEINGGTFEYPLFKISKMEKWK